VAALQGNMAQNARQAAMNGFRDGRYDILVATDIAARGIDVTEISHVINFDMPDTVDAYTHRIGRTGRMEQSGEAFTFATPADELMVRDIEKVLKAPLERRRLAGFDYGSFPVESRSNASRPAPARPRTTVPSNTYRATGNAPRPQANRSPADAATRSAPASATARPRRRRYTFAGSR
jgi:ATP-dependent RNA helicase RhlE